MARPRSEEARSRALSGALEVLGNVGIDGFGVDAVSRVSGVAKTTIYRHWPNVTQLLVEALDAMVAPIPTPNTGSFRHDLHHFLVDLVPVVNDPRTASMLLDVLRSSLVDPEFERVHSALMAERKKPVITVLELAKRRGEVSSDVDAKLVTEFIEGAIFARRFLRRELIDERAIDEILDMLMLIIDG